MQECRNSEKWLHVCLALLGVLQVGAVLATFEMPAQAYVDPGSGYVLLQVIGSMAIGGLYYVRHRVRKLLASIRGKQLPEAAVGSKSSADVPPFPEQPDARR